MTENGEAEGIERQESVILYSLLTSVVSLAPLPAAPDGVVGAMRAYMVREIGEELGLRFPMGALLARVTTRGPGVLDLAYSYGRSMGRTILGKDKPFGEIVAEISPVFAHTLFIGRELLEAAERSPEMTGEGFITYLDEALVRAGRDLSAISGAFEKALDSMGETGSLLVKGVVKTMVREVGGNIVRPDPVALGMYLAKALPQLFNQSKSGFDIMLSLLRVEVFGTGES